MSINTRSFPSTKQTPQVPTFQKTIHISYRKRTRSTPYVLIHRTASNGTTENEREIRQPCPLASLYSPHISSACSPYPRAQTHSPLLTLSSTTDWDKLVLDRRNFTGFCSNSSRSHFLSPEHSLVSAGSQI